VAERRQVARRRPVGLRAVVAGRDLIRACRWRSRSWHSEEIARDDELGRESALSTWASSRRPRKGPRCASGPSARRASRCLVLMNTPM